MKSYELSDEVEAIVFEAQSRIMGPGKDQYSRGDRQQFEGMAFPALITYMEEELLDQVNYAVMNLIRLRRFRDAYLEVCSFVQTES